jgi:branched-chain amino acid transport system substrate-binding protein
MIGQSLVDAFPKGLKKSFGTMPGSTGKGAGVFADVAKAAGIDSSGPYTGESYDAAALIVLAMQAGNSADRASIAKNVMGVANEPGTKIYPGELKKGLDLLAKGKKINYEGATGVTFTNVGEAEGSFLEQEIKGGKFKTKKQR